MGKPIPDGWAQGPDGKETNDPEEVGFKINLLLKFYTKRRSLQSLKGLIQLCRIVLRGHRVVVSKSDSPFCSTWGGTTNLMMLPAKKMVAIQQYTKILQYGFSVLFQWIYFSFVTCCYIMLSRLLQSHNSVLVSSRSNPRSSAGHPAQVTNGLPLRLFSFLSFSGYQNSLPDAFRWW